MHRRSRLAVDRRLLSSACLVAGCRLLRRRMLIGLSSLIPVVRVRSRVRAVCGTFVRRRDRGAIRCGVEQGIPEAGSIARRAEFVPGRLDDGLRGVRLGDGIGTRASGLSGREFLRQTAGFGERTVGGLERKVRGCSHGHRQTLRERAQQCIEPGVRRRIPVRFIRGRMRCAAGRFGELCGDVQGPAPPDACATMPCVRSRSSKSAARAGSSATNSAMTFERVREGMASR